MVHDSLKILHVLTSMNPELGGVCQVIRDTIPALSDLGVVSEVLCFDHPKAGYLDRDNFIINAIGPAYGPYSYCPALSPWLKKHMRQFDTIIIHGLWQHHSWGTYRDWVKADANLGQVNPKLVIMPHGMLDPYFQNAPDRKWKAIRNRIFWKLFESQTVNGASGLLFTCEQEKLLAREPFTPYNPAKEIVVGLGTTAPPIFQESFRRAFLKALPEVDGKSYYLFLSRIHPKKGVELLISAYLQALSRNPEIPDLVIAGPGLSTDYGNAMQTLGSHLKIHFPGMLSGPTKWGAFYGCEAFILPSHQENFGIAVTEALACKKPVLISNQVNIWREIEKNEAGIIFPDTFEGTFKALTTFSLMNSLEKQEMAQKAEHTFKNYYLIKNTVTQLVNTINEINKVTKL